MILIGYYNKLFLLYQAEIKAFFNDVVLTTHLSKSHRYKDINIVISNTLRTGDR